MANRLRPHSVHIMCTEEEKKLIEDKCKLAGFSNTAAYMRKIAIDGQIFKLDPTPLQTLSSQVTGIARNINQIAKRVNSTDKIHNEDIRELKETIDEIWQSLKSILLKLP